MTPEQPLALASPRAQEQSRDRARALLLLRSSLRPQDQPSPQRLPIVPPQPLLMPLPQGPARHLLSPSAQPPVQPLPKPQAQPSPSRPLLALEQSLVRLLPQRPPQPPLQHLHHQNRQPLRALSSCPFLLVSFVFTRPLDHSTPEVISSLLDFRQPEH